MKKQTVYLDMDGTVADLYNSNDWLKRLINEDTEIFKECKPLVTQEKLFEKYPQDKYDIKVLSMTPKGASKEYCEHVIQQKNEWLDKYFPQLQKRIYKKYGYNKNLKNSKNAILIDDNEKIRNNFKGLALAPNWAWTFYFYLLILL